MQIKEMFAKEIDRDLQGVIVVGQKGDDAQQELEEYVVTRELQRHFADFFSAYKKGIVGNTTKTGVWISGFFGSGKSHFLKIISYILANDEIKGKKAIDYFIDDSKISDPMVLADMQLASNTPTDVILFNIDSKSDSNGKQNKDAIVNVFLKVFNEKLGFCGAIPVLADLERRLSDDGRYDEFKEKFEKIYGSSWESSRQDFDFIQDDVVDTLVEMNFMSEQAARNWCEKVIEPYKISIEDFAKRVRDYLDTKENNHHIVFLVDEIGQYIGEDSNLMLNLQTVREELGKECQGKAWVIVTSQQDIDSISDVKGNDFSKIQGRFDTRLVLSSANVDEVIKKRVLEKNDTAAQTLRLLYGQKSTFISNLIHFDGTVERKIYADENDFATVYPFVPYQFNLLASVLTSIRTHGASGKHLSEGERSMLAMFKESAVNYKEREEGTIIPFHAFYDALENFLDHSHRGVIIKAYDNNSINPEHKTKDVFEINVLKTLFMIKYLDKEIKATVENITSLMISNIDEKRGKLKEGVEDALKVLERQMLIQRNGDIYIFLTNEEQEINREIERQGIDRAQVVNKASELIFEGILKDKTYQYTAFNGRYAFGFNQFIDDRPYKSLQGFDISVRVLTPGSDYGNDETTLRMVSGQGKEVLVVLPNDRTFMIELERYLKLESFLRQDSVSSLPQYEDIKAARGKEMRERYSNAKMYLIESLKTADIYVNGDKIQTNIKEPTSRIKEALGKLVATVYHKLPYIDTAFSEDDVYKLLKGNNKGMINFDENAEHNVHALEDVLQYIAANSRLHMKTSMKSIKERFMKAPYGFVEDDVFWLIARLFKRGDLAFTVNGSSVTFYNKATDEIANYITKKAFVEKLMIEEKAKVSDKEKKLTRDIMKELFGTSGVSNDEDVVMNTFIGYASEMSRDLGSLIEKYEMTDYPGKHIIEYGKKLLFGLSQINTVPEFYQTVSKKQDELLDFAEDYEPIKAFFNSEQKGIFDKALLYLGKYNDSKTYIVDDNLDDVANEIKAIVKEKQPYKDIPKLPELLKKFGDAYSDVLNEQLSPVLDSIYDSQGRVFDVLKTKEYSQEKQSSYIEQFNEIIYGAKGCTNVSTLRGYADRAEALKIRLLNEMDAKDHAIAMKKAEEIRKRLEQEAQQNGQVDHEHIEAEVKKEVKVKKTKNVTIKKITKSASWRLETTEDIDNYLVELRTRLVSELEADTIVNVEF